MRAAIAKRALAWAAIAFSVPSASAGVPARPTIDRVVARFYAPGIGGIERPKLVTERTLAFETRLEQILDGTDDAGYPERDVRAALDHDVVEQMLAGLADKLVADSPADKRPATSELEGVQSTVTQALLERLGGRARVDEAAGAEGLDAAEVDALLRRSARAAWYLDRAVDPLLHPSEDKLRDVYRSSRHPYAGLPFDAVRKKLARWVIVERLRADESVFLQAARSRIHVVVTGR